MCFGVNALLIFGWHTFEDLRPAANQVPIDFLLGVGVGGVGGTGMAGSHYCRWQLLMTGTVTLKS